MYVCMYVCMYVILRTHFSRTHQKSFALASRLVRVHRHSWMAGFGTVGTSEKVAIFWYRFCENSISIGTLTIANTSETMGMEENNLGRTILVKRRLRLQQLVRLSDHENGGGGDVVEGSSAATLETTKWSTPGSPKRKIGRNLISMYVVNETVLEPQKTKQAKMMKNFAKVSMKKLRRVHMHKSDSIGAATGAHVVDVQVKKWVVLRSSELAIFHGTLTEYTWTGLLVTWTYRRGRGMDSKIDSRNRRARVPPF